MQEFIARINTDKKIYHDVNIEFTNYKRTENEWKIMVAASHGKGQSLPEETMVQVCFVVGVK